MNPGVPSRTDPAANIRVFLPLPCKGTGVAYSCASILGAIDKAALGVTIFTPYAYRGATGNARSAETLPWALRLVPYRFLHRYNVATRFNERSFYEATKKAAGENVIAYMWPDPSLAVLRGLRELDVPIVREMINVHRGTAKPILDAEYRRIGLHPQHSISAASVLTERQALEYCDYMFCSNLLSEQSLIENGVPAHKIRMGGFGWDPDRFRGDSRALPVSDGPMFLFVGYVCVGKGAHLLLKYWAKSGIKGRLVLVGKMEPAIASTCREYLRRPDVTVIKYTRNIAPIYRSADVFVFPSLAEGGPQVTSEAAGCRLPLITSPMGAALTAVHGQTGFVVDPLDESGWIEAMRMLARDPDLRRRAGSAAFQRAQRFTWERVGSAREAVFREIAEESFGSGSRREMTSRRERASPNATGAEVDADFPAKFVGEPGAAASSQT